MFSEKTKIAVASQICNMLYNNICQGNGGESFLGWCADGEVFEEEVLDIDECMKLVEELTPDIDKITWKLDYLHNNFD